MQSHTDVDTNELIITRAQRSSGCDTSVDVLYTITRVPVNYPGRQATISVINKCTTLTQYTRCYENYAKYNGSNYSEAKLPRLIA